MGDKVTKKMMKKVCRQSRVKREGSDDLPCSGGSRPVLMGGPGWGRWVGADRNVQRGGGGGGGLYVILLLRVRVRVRVSSHRERQQLVQQVASQYELLLHPHTQACSNPISPSSSAKAVIT